MVVRERCTFGSPNIQVRVFYPRQYLKGACLFILVAAEQGRGACDSFFKGFERTFMSLLRLRTESVVEERGVMRNFFATSAAPVAKTA